MSDTLSIDDIRHHIQQDLLNDPDANLQPDDDLLLSGLLDSLNVVKLVSHLEQQCAITIAPEDVLVEHFGSLNQIMSYLKTRGSA